MNTILTGTNLAGYDAQLRTVYNQDLFRCMSIMAIAENQTLHIIQPNRPAQIMKYNPYREDREELQTYVATLTGFTLVDDASPHVDFTVQSLYQDIATANYTVYYNGRVTTVPLTAGTATIEIQDSAWVASFQAALDAGILSEDTVITAHLIKDGSSIDMSLDWSGMVKSTPINAGSDKFRDIDERVKSAAHGDTYTTWRAINPTGISAEYSNSTGATKLNLDTGIVCASTLSCEAPTYISITMEDYVIDLYLNIDELPMYCLPEYKMHPGQYLYTKAAELDYDGEIIYDTDHYKVVIAGDIRSHVTAGDSIQIYRRGLSYEATVDTVTYENQNTYITINETTIPTGDVSMHVITYTYTDGEVFNSDRAETYRTPASARMFILRGEIEFAEQPYIPDTNDNLFTIATIEYVFPGESLSNGLFPTYAIAHYAVDITSRTYREIGDARYDNVESMRHIGHYGRNNQFNYIIDAPIALATVPNVTSFDVPSYTREHRKLIAAVDDNNFIVGHNTVEVNLANLRGKLPDIVSGYADYNGSPGFYYYYHNIMPMQVIANVLIHKLYITENFIIDDALLGDIYAYDTSMGYILAMLEDAEERKLSNAILSDDDSLGVSVQIELKDMEYTMLIESEVITGIADASLETMKSLSRGLHGTRAAYHAADVDVMTMNPNFTNVILGYITEIDGDVLEIRRSGNNEPSIESDWYVLVGHEILFGAPANGNDDDHLEFTISERQCYGSELVTLSVGQSVMYVSYFRYADIHPNKAPTCEYSGKYRARVTLPLNYPIDPVRFGAKSVYLLEFKYETSQKNKVR